MLGNDRNEMKKLLLILFIILIVSGCSKASSAIPLTETGEVPTLFATVEDYSSAETTTPIDVIETVEPTSSPPEQPQIILFIGDGMGAEHRLAGQYYSVGEMRQLMMDTLPVSGWLETDSYGGQLGESASGATALATGYLTNNEVVSLDVNGNQLKTILEYTQDLDMSVGLISTKYIADSTTGVFAAHVEHSSMRTEIASQLIEHQVDVIFGGGENDFLPSGVEGCHPEVGNRLDGRNLIEEAEAAGYTIVCDQQSFDKLDPQTDSLVIGLFADENMVRPYSPSLADMTRTAIDILSLNPNGFFLVIEGGMIDIASHLHESQNVLDEVIGFDQAVKVGMEFGQSEENTLIIVTADHETGGMVVNLIPNGKHYEDGPFYMPNGTEFYISWLTGGHTAAHIPVSAIGLGTEKLFGINENTLVFDVMLEFLGIAKIEE